MQGIDTQNQIRRLMGERDLLLSAIAPADYAKIQAQLVAIAESPEPLSPSPEPACAACRHGICSAHREQDHGGAPSPEIRYQLRNWHHVNCAGFGGQACTCLEQREALIAELALKEAR